MGALAKYLAEKDDLHAGKKPRDDGEGYTIKMLCNDFLNAKKASVDAGELTQRSWQNYKETCELVLTKFAKSRLVANLDPHNFRALRKAMVEKGVGCCHFGELYPATRCCGVSVRHSPASSLRAGLSTIERLAYTSADRV